MVHKYFYEIKCSCAQVIIKLVLPPYLSSINQLIDFQKHPLSLETVGTTALYQPMTMQANQKHLL